MSNLAIEDLAASVADGDDVDWEARELEAGGDQHRRVLRDLRVIAGIAAFCRTQAVDEPPLPFVPPDAAAAARPPGLGNWGAFELIQKIGEGAFGDVYRARDALHRDVALKLLRHASGRSAEQQAARILHEGRVLARVRHPSVVTVYGAEDHDGRVGLWMEFIEGRTLEALLQSQGSFGAREAALIGRELCRALAAVHGAGLVHRDIKAQNVMREAGGRLVLMDFGAGQMIQERGARPAGASRGRRSTSRPSCSRAAPASVQQRHLQPGRPAVHLVTGGYPGPGVESRGVCGRPTRPTGVAASPTFGPTCPKTSCASSSGRPTAIRRDASRARARWPTRCPRRWRSTPGATRRGRRRRPRGLTPTVRSRRDSPASSSARGLWLAAIAACLAIGAAIWAWPRGSTSPGERSPSTRAHAIRLAVRASDAGEPSLTSLLRRSAHAGSRACRRHLRMIAPARGRGAA